MSITGEPDGRPMKVGVAISDVVTGLFGAVSLLAGLLGGSAGRPGAEAGQGQRIDVSLLQSTLAVLVNQAQNALVTGAAPAPARQRPPQHRPVRDVRDRRRRDRDRRSGASGSGPGSGRRSGCRRLATDARFATNGDRVEQPRRADPDPRRRGSPTEPTRTGSRASRTPGSPPGPILDLPAAFASPQAHGLGTRRRSSIRASARRPGRIPFGRPRPRDPDAAAAPRRAHHGRPRRGRLRRARRSGLRERGVDLRVVPLDARDGRAGTPRWPACDDHCGRATGADVQADPDPG